MSLKSLTKIALVLTIALMAGCRGSESKKPPIHLNPNMDLQEKYKDQETSTFFEDGTTMRVPVEGTVPHSNMYLRNGADFLKADKAFYDGVAVSGAYVDTIPDLKTLGFANKKELLKRGQQRYEIYCTPCHGSTGDANGPVSEAVRGKGIGFPGILDFTADTYVAASSAGKTYNAINKGGAIMPSYAYQIKVRDRWAIVAYVKVLQEAAQKAVKENNK